MASSPRQATCTCRPPRPQGAPYGYTPFCDNNREMEGFRFWKQGFWRDHLQGRPYHISALYVVDLERFRQASLFLGLPGDRSGGAAGSACGAYEYRGPALPRTGRRAWRLACRM